MRPNAGYPLRGRLNVSDPDGCIGVGFADAEMTEEEAHRPPSLSQGLAVQ
jgi:hypothetical protein